VVAQALLPAVLDTRVETCGINSLCAGRPSGRLPIFARRGNLSSSAGVCNPRHDARYWSPARCDEEARFLSRQMG